MGASNKGLRHVNPPHQEEMGWRSPAVNVLITESGIYNIAPQELYEGGRLNRKFSASQSKTPTSITISLPSPTGFRRQSGLVASEYGDRAPLLGGRRTGYEYLSD